MTTKSPELQAQLSAWHRMLDVRDRMDKCRKNHLWQEHTELQTELDKLNMILYGTVAPGVY